MFAHGKLAMYLGGPWQIETFLREEPQLPWEMFWAPRLAADQPRKFASGGTGWGITPNARNQELSWEFLKFIDRKPGSYEIELETNAPLAVYLSSYLPVNEKEIARLKKLGMANVDILVKGATEVQWWPFHPDWPRVTGRRAQPGAGQDAARGGRPGGGAARAERAPHAPVADHLTRCPVSRPAARPDITGASALTRCSSRRPPPGCGR